MKYKYDITLSFAGEDREYVNLIAKLLKENNVRVFYDKFEESDLWGKDLGIHFDTIYRKSARYCIPFISKHYKSKVWTNYEIRNAISRAIEQNEEYILPARFDDTEIEGIRPTLGFIDLRKKTPEEFVEIILRKIGSEKSIPVSQIFQEKKFEIIKISILHSYITSPSGIRDNGPIIAVTITNKLEGSYRYFYEPTFRVTKPIENDLSGFHLTNPLNPHSFPVKLEYGAEIKINYLLSKSQLELWLRFKEECEFYSICSTTIGEKFESNKEKISSIIDALK